MKTESGKSIDYWRDLVRRGGEHPSGVRSFCEAEGIHKSVFYYWRSKLNQKKKTERPAAIFAKVEVVKPRAVRELPDPRWLAEFLLALGAAR